MEVFMPNPKSQTKESFVFDEAAEIATVEGHAKDGGRIVNIRSKVSDITTGPSHCRRIVSEINLDHELNGRPKRAGEDLRTIEARGRGERNERGAEEMGRDLISMNS
jgi:hypothetical protein